MSERPEMSCAVCLRKLNHVLHLDGSEAWLHGLTQEDGADHEPEPVPEDSIATIYSCDFCYESPAEYRLPVKPFDKRTIAGRLVGGSDGDWANCWSCAALVESDQWMKLTNRVVRSYEARMGSIPTEVRALLWEHLQIVRSNVAGHVRENRP
jgi:hypothetical protein